MPKQLKGIRYRKWKGGNRQPRKGQAGYVGRVHLQYYDKANKAWRFVCGKKQSATLMFATHNGDPVDDDTPMTCVACQKIAPEVVDHMDNLEEPEDLAVQEQQPRKGK